MDLDRTVPRAAPRAAGCSFRPLHPLHEQLAARSGPPHPSLEQLAALFDPLTLSASSWLLFSTPLTRLRSSWLPFSTPSPVSASSWLLFSTPPPVSGAAGCWVRGRRRRHRERSASSGGVVIGADPGCAVWAGRKGLLLGRLGDNRQRSWRQNAARGRRILVRARLGLVKTAGRRKGRRPPGSMRQTRRTKRHRRATRQPLRRPLS
jgi:hypothetical protein